MRVLTASAIIALAGMTAACAATANGDPASGSGGMSGGAVATLADPSGATKANATVTDTGSGIKLTVEAMGLSPGARGIHFHTTGRCDAPDFATAGPHWNPNGKKHGAANPAGPHWGDLPNLVIGTDGTGRLEATIPGTRLTDGDAPLLDADGAALVIHAAADDYKTDPSGNSGGRIACGVIAAR